MKRTLLSLLLICLICTSARADFTLPPDVAVIGDEAFLNVPVGKSMTIPNRTRKIGARAFKNSGLKQVELPPDLNAIADDAFDSGVSFRTTLDSLAWQWCRDNGRSVDTIGVDAVELYNYYHVLGEEAAIKLKLQWKPMENTAMGPYMGAFTDGCVRMGCDNGRRNYPGGITSINLVADPAHAYTLCGVSLGMDNDAAIDTLKAAGWNARLHGGGDLLSFGPKDDAYIYLFLGETSVRQISLVGCAQKPDYRALLIGVKTHLDKKHNVIIQERFENDLTMVNGGLLGVNDGAFKVVHCVDPETKEAVGEACSEVFGNNTEDDVSIIFISTHGKNPTVPLEGSDNSETEESGTNIIYYGEMCLKYDVPFTPAELADCLKNVKGMKIILLGHCLSGGALEGHYKDALRAPDTVVITAAQWNEYSTSASELKLLLGTEDNINAFSETIFKALDNIAADTNPKDGTITLREFFDYLKIYVPDNSYRQTGFAGDSHPATNLTRENYYFPLFWK